MKFEIRPRSAAAEMASPGPDFARWRSAEGDVLATFHRTSDGYLVRFKDRGDFDISLTRRLVTCRPAPGVSDRVAEDLYQNQVLPMIHGQEGELVLHASAIALDGEVLAFSAPTGHGKSTLAAAFAQAGIPFLSDDGLHLRREGDRYIAEPNRARFRLWQDSAFTVLRHGESGEEQDEKSLIDARGTFPFQEHPLPLRALYFLGPGDHSAAHIEAMSPQAALAEMMNQTFLLDAAEKTRLQAHFDALAELSATVPAFALDYPRDYGELEGVIAAIVEHSRKRNSSQ